MSNQNIKDKIKIFDKFHKEIQEYRLSLCDNHEVPRLGEERNCELLVDAEWDCLQASERLVEFLQIRKARAK